MTLEQLNLIRKGNGQEPLDKLPDDISGTKEEDKGDGQETPEQIEAKRKQAELEAKEKGKNKDDENADPELSDDQVLALLAKRGIAATSLDDLKKKDPVDPAKLAEQQEAAELAFGLTKGIFTKNEYDLYARDAQNLNNIVYDEFYADTKAANPEMKDEDIQAEFLSTYGLDKDKDSYQFKRGMKILQHRGEVLLKTKHAKIFSAKDSFNKNEQTTQAAAETQRKVAAALPTYKADVKTIIGELKKITVKMSDEESIDVEDNDDLIAGIEEDLMNPEYYTVQLANGYDKEKIRQAVLAGFMAKNFNALTVKVAKKYLDKHKAGTSGVPAGGSGAGKIVDMSQFTESQKKMIEMHQADKDKKQQK